MSDVTRTVERIEGFLGAARFPIFLISLLAAVFVGLVTILLIPESSGSIGAFANAFRVWCYQLDPATHELQPVLVVTMLAQPLALSAILIVVWWSPLRQASAEGWPGAGPWVAAGVGLVGLVATGVYAVAAPLPARDLAFPADELRMSRPAPDWALTDQDGQSISLSDLRGRVVLLTAIYAHCTSMCPSLLAEAREAIDGLPAAQVDDLTVAAITLDPTRDTPQRMSELAAAYGVSAPRWRLLTGPVPEVERALDAYDISRVRDPATGEIQHPGMYFLIDRRGWLAWRLAVGDGQRAWLRRGLEILLEEPEVRS